MNKWLCINFISACLFSTSLYAAAGIDSTDAINLGSITPGSAANATANICVWSEDANGDYEITMTSLNTADNKFRMKLSGESDYIEYTVEFNDKISGGIFDDVTYNTALVGQTTGLTASSCSVDNARVRVNIAANETKTVPAGSYTDTLTLTVAEPG